MKTALIAIASLVLVACSHAEKAADPAVTPASDAPAAASSPADVSERYSLSELNGAANALKVVIDQGAAKPSEDRGSDIFGCSLTAAQAVPMMMPLKAMIDGAVRGEVEAYSQDPKTYSSDHGFESCASSCSCGVWSDVVEDASDVSTTGVNPKIHARNQQRLKAKAARQSTADSLACARKQSWFCTSDLKTYLEKQAAENAP